MKKFKSALLFILAFLVILAFTVPSESDFETHINQELKESSGEGFLGLNDLMNNILTEAIKLTSEYKDLKVCSTYTFKISENNEFQYIGFGTLIFKVKGEYETPED